MQQQRVEKLRKILTEKNLDGFLVSNFYNILYLSEFKTLTNDEREAWVFITNKNVYLFTDRRYVGSLSSRAKRSDLDNKEIASSFSTPRNDIIIKLITPEKGLIKHLQDVNLVSLEKTIIKIRGIKDEEEIKNIKMACKIADECLKYIVKTIKVGSSEKEIAFKIEFWLKEKNYDLAFYPIVAIDENSSLPHYDTRGGDNKKVKNGSIILIDFGAKYQNYLSDISRMIFVGKPTDEMINIYNKLLSVQEKTIATLSHRSGVINGQTRLQTVDAFCRKQLTTNYSYPHSTGHGVGLEIHEYPKISSVSTDEIKAGQVFTIEPGIYIPNKWGMRIEDTVLVKEDGVEILTKFRKQPLII